jgi:predicted permease
MFTLVNGVVLKPLPYDEPDRLMVVREASPQAELPASYPAFEYYRDNLQSFEAVGFYGAGAATLRREGSDAVQLDGGTVSAEVFGLLRVKPIVGRGFLPEDDETDAEPVVVLSHATWTNLFAGDPGVVGRTVRLGLTSTTIVGVMPPDFRFPSADAQIWFSTRNWTRRPQTHGGTIIGRLRTDVTVEQARADVDRVRQGLDEDNPVAGNGDVTQIKTLQAHIVGDNGRIFAAFTVAVGLLLLLACANLANLLLARSNVRHKEIAVRRALGSSGRRIAQLMVAESVLLAMVGSVVGVLIARWGIQVLIQFAPQALPRTAEIGIDTPVVAFALGISLLAGVVIGLVPVAQQMSTDLVNEIRAGGRGTGARPLQNAFTVVQVALAFVLLAGAGLLAKSLWNLQTVDIGFDPEGALIVSTSAPRSRFPEIVERADYFRRLGERIRQVPGVTAAGAISMLPFTGWSNSDFQIEGRDIPEDQLPWLEFDFTTPGFFEAMGIPLLAGRTFAESDRVGSAGVIVINEAMARQIWPNEDPIGRRIGGERDDTGEIEWVTVVGVVGDVTHRSLQQPANPKFFRPFHQSDWPFGMSMIVRTNMGDPLQLSGAMREAVRELQPDPPPVRTRSLASWMELPLSRPRFDAALLAIFTAGALALATLGLYAVISFGVAQRTHELGVRIALGASRGAVRREVLGRGLKMSLIGIAVGGLGAAALTRFLSSMLFGVTPLDPLVFASVPALLVVVAMLASGIPSLRASRVDPLEVLREE